MEELYKLQTFNLADRTAKVKILTGQVAENIIEIGKTLLEVKEHLPYGEFQIWLKNDINYSKSTAYNFMKVAKEFQNFQSVGNLGMRKLLALTGLETEDREKISTEYDFEKITVKEVEKIIEEEKLLKKVDKFMKRMSHKIPPYQKKPKDEIYDGLPDEDIEILENGVVEHYKVSEWARNEMYESLKEVKRIFNNNKLFAEWVISLEVIDEFEELIGGLLDKAIEEENKN